MYKHDGSKGNWEGFRVTRVAKDSNGKVIKRTGLHQIAQPTYEEYLDAEMQLKKWAWVQTEIIMREMATATPEEIAAVEFEDAEEIMKLYEREKEMGD